MAQIIGLSGGATLTDEELDNEVGEIHHDFLCVEIDKSGHGCLLSCGYRVQQQRVREAQQIVDPEDSLMQHLSVVNRWQYQVLMHIQLLSTVHTPPDSAKGYSNYLCQLRSSESALNQECQLLT